MEYYFSDRSYNIIGMASTTLKDAIRIYDDLEAEDIDSGLSSFEGKIYFTDDKDGNIDVVTEMCQKGNYILYRNRLGKDRFFTIIETEKDRKENSISFYAEDGGLDLINEVVGPFESTTAQPASFYLEEFLKDSGFTIGLNEIVNLSRKLKWEGESSVTSRIRSVATQFDNAEISFSFEIEGMVVSEKKVNIHKKRGNETNETLTLGKEIDNIKTIESIENLATSLLPKGGTPEGENAVPIDLKGYVYDDGRFYVNKDGFVRDRESRTIWNRFSTTPSDDTGFINKPFSYDTLSKSELLNRAIGKLKEISKPDQNFIVDIITLPDNVSLGDRINIVDERDDLNLSTRVLKLEIEEGINKCTALLGEFIIKQKTIGEKLQDIADNLKDNMKPGDTYYPSVAYADDSEGNGFSMSPDNKAYIAIIHQKNNSISSTNPKDYEGQWIHIKGLNGEDGLPGKDGVGLKSTTITYAYNKSSLNPPTSGWTSDVPQTPPGDYLWTRTIWKYTDNKEETGYSVSRIGKDGNTGNDGIAGKDGVGLKSTSVDYASSSSGTIIPTSGWSLNIPEVPTGQFLWTRTIWTYTDNTNERGYSVSRIGLNGTNGKDGIAGKDGVGLKSTTIRYAASEDGITPPVIWYADIQPVPPGQFLWTQTTWSYTDDTKEVGYSVSKIGEDGMKGDDGVAGKDGVGIENTKIQYTASSDGSNPPTSGWTDQIPIVTPGKFLWTRTVWTYTDGTNETGYSISRIGEDGTDGIAGKDGFGLKSTSITYAGSTSGTTAPSGGWSNNVPAVPAGNYLWTKTTWVYTDNTNETGYTVSRIGKDGNTGKDGIAGKDGVGIKSTAITYAKSTNGTTAPTTGYTTTVPSTNPGDYLWTKTVWTYTDNTNETGYSVGKIGNTGATGATGAQGPQGIQGPAGTNGTSQYVHIRYSANSNGSGMTPTPQSNTQYIGLANTTNATAPAVNTSYTWTKIKGETGAQGNQGIQGPAGTNGQTTYTWVKYADTNTGTGMNDNPDGKLYIGLAFNKTTQTESDTASDYTWSLMPQNIEIGTKTQDELENISHIYFDNNGYIEFPDEAKNLVHGGTEATIEFWNKQDSLAYGLVQLSGFNNTNGILYPYQNYQTVYLDVFRTNRLGPITMKKPVNRWHHFAITTHPTEGWKLYQDGDLVYTASAQSTVNVSYLKFRVGQNSGNRYSNAGYRDIRLWNKARTHQEIITNMNQDVPESEDGLVGYWKVNEGSGETVLDLVNGNNGAIINGEWRGLQNKLNEKADQNQVNNALDDINSSLTDKVGIEEFEKLEQFAKQFAESYKQFVSEGGRYLEDVAALEERFTQIFLELGANTLDLQFLNTYFRAGEEGLLIGSEDSQIKMLLTNDRLSFQEGIGANAKEIAYFSGQSFIINSGAIVQDFQIGEHKFTNIGGGHTVVQWVTK